jgi:hypothetical protein
LGKGQRLVHPGFAEPAAERGLQQSRGMIKFLRVDQDVHGCPNALRRLLMPREMFVPDFLGIEFLVVGWCGRGAACGRLLRALRIPGLRLVLGAGPGR